MWEPDGWGHRARIGLLIPYSNTVQESEFRAMAPQGVSIHTTRMPRPEGFTPGPGEDSVRGYVRTSIADDAAALMATAPVNAIAMCITNTSFPGSVAEDLKLVDRLQERTNGIPVTVTCLAAVAGLRALGSKRIAYINPSWAVPASTDAAAAYFTDAGFDIAFAAPADLPRTAAHNVEPAALYDWVRANVPDNAEAVFIGGNGMRAIATIKALEEDLSRPVLTANQVTLWQCLHICRVNAPIAGYGRIFDLPLSNERA